MKKLTKDVGKVGAVGIGIGVGGAIAGRLGHGGETFAAMGRMMPVVSTTVMGGHVLRIAKKNLGGKKYKR